MRCCSSGRFVRGDGDADGLETSNISASHLAVVGSRYEKQENKYYIFKIVSVLSEL